MEQRRRLFFELAVIFVGVTAAFFVENWREDRRDDRRARQTVAAIHRDLADFVAAADQFSTVVDEGLADWQAAYERGERPPPFSLRIPGAEGAPIGVWEAALQTGLTDLLDPALVFDLASFYGEVKGVSARYVRYAEMTESFVWRQEVADPAGFYGAGGELAPPFAAHRRMLDEIRDAMGQQQEWAAALMARLRETLPEIRDVEIRESIVRGYRETREDR